MARLMIRIALSIFNHVNNITGRYYFAYEN